MVYCALSLRIIGSIYINHFEPPTHVNYVGHNQKKDTHALDFDVTLRQEKRRLDKYTFLCYLE